MNLLLAAILLPLHFTAPADTLGTDRSGVARVSALPAYAYVFHRLASNGMMAVVPGYADSVGRTILVPHAPGTRETVWLDAGPSGSTVTIFVMSRDAVGNMSAPSNGCVLGDPASAPTPTVRHAAWTSLDVPIVRGAPERCGPAALAMVLRYYRAPAAAVREANTAYDPALGGSCMDDLAVAARRAGFAADIATLTSASLIDLLNDGVPPIVLYQSGPVGRFGVVTGWDATRGSFTIHDGTARPRVAGREELTRKWETAGSQALIVRPATP